MAQVIREQIGYPAKELIVQELPSQKLVKDATLKFAILDNPGNKLAFVLMSNDDYPDAVAHAAQSAQKASQIVGSQLSKLVLQPSFMGVIGKNSYAVFPYLMPLRIGKFSRFINRQVMTNKIFDWLTHVSKRTTKIIAKEHFQTQVIEPLLWISECPIIHHDIQADALNAVNAMEKIKWVPKHAFSHNDLWSGNVLALPSFFGKRAASFGIGEPRIIDWLSSSEYGIPVYDIINYANSTGASLRKVAYYLKQINQYSGQDNNSCYFDLLAGFGRLGMNRGQFPLEIYAKQLEKIVNSYKQICIIN